MKTIFVAILFFTTGVASATLPPVTGSGITGHIPIWTNGPNSELGDSKIRQYSGGVAVETPNSFFHAGDFNGDGARNYIHIGSNGNIDVQSTTKITLGDAENQSDNPNGCEVRVHGKLMLPNLLHCARLGTDADGFVVCKEFEQ